MATIKTWGALYGASYFITDTGERVRMYRKRQAVRFYTDAGDQVGPEQPNVGPAIVWLDHVGWRREGSQLLKPIGDPGADAHWI